MAAITSERARGDGPLRVMTFNLRYATAADGENAWERRKDLLADTIRAFKPDLLGTQEALAVQIDFLTQQFPEYVVVGVGRDDGARRGEFSAALARREIFEVLDSGTFWLSETPDKPGSKSWDSSLPRIATWAHLRQRGGAAGEFCFLNTHWDHRGNRARVESARLIRRWLASHAPEHAIVTGDFNADENHPAYRALIAETPEKPRLIDAYREVHPQAQGDEVTFHNFLGVRRGRRIDFVLHTSDMKAVEADIDRTKRDGHYPSDHYPVTAVLVPAGN